MRARNAHEPFIHADLDVYAFLARRLNYQQQPMTRMRLGKLRRGEETGKRAQGCVFSGTHDERQGRCSTAGVLVSGLVAYVLALQADGIYALVQDSSAFGGAGIFIIVMFGLFTRVGGPRAAAAALVTGIVVWLAAGRVLHLSVPYLASLAAACAAYLLVALFERTPAPAPVAATD